MNQNFQLLINRLDLEPLKTKTMTEKKTIYADGIRLFTPREGAPDFVKGAIVVTPSDLLEWLNNNPQYGSDYNGKKQFRLQLLDGRDGLYLSVDTYKKDEASPQPTSASNNDNNLPF